MGLIAGPVVGGPPRPGSPHPLGASVEADGVNFSVFSKSAERLELVLYDHVDDAAAARVIGLERATNRTTNYWHVFVPGLGAGQVYGFRAHGAFDPDVGKRFDGQKLLIDPYGRAVAMPTDYQRAAAAAPGDNDGVAMKSVVADLRHYDWEGDAPLRRPFAQTVIYEMHVAGFTKHPSSGIDERVRGTYRGLIEKIPYLAALGVTAVELLPVFQFDPQKAPEGLVNYWGYAPVSFFAVHTAYGSTDEPLAVLDEFRDMVKALHRAGIEVILDVVYGQTAEGGADGATQSWRGLENEAYYMLENGGRDYADYSGTGNTLNTSHSVVRRMILDSLRYWVDVMHVDGFRFDLASILTRDANGKPIPRPPLLWDIESDPVLAGTKLIAEAWDAAGLYQVGSFGGDFWKEWNGQFRDDVRSFVRGDEGLAPTLADRLLGSPDLYGERPHEPERSINFITAHDGFTLSDLVSYGSKHNSANGEDSKDGSNDNRSCNYGVEGPTDDPEIESIRAQQIKNLMAINMLSLGAPMLVMGDEVRRTQHGNNNAYCQDNEISWFDWGLVASHAEMLRFTQELIKLRWLRESVKLATKLSLAELRSMVNVSFHGIRAGQPDHAHHSRSLALTATSLSGDLHMYYAINAWTEPLEFELPSLPDSLGWRRVIDTSLPSPDDICQPAIAPPVQGATYMVKARSVVSLFAPPQG